MEPIKRTTYVKVEYWDCGNADHRHKSSVIADNCIKLCANTKPTPPPEINRARYILATREVLNGATYKKAGETIGVSSERARQIVRQVLRITTHPNIVPAYTSFDPSCFYKHINQVREDKDYWLAKIDKLAEYWGV